MPMEKIISIEEKVVNNINLLEIAKSYCEFNYEKADEIITLSFLLNTILNNQKEIFEKLVD